MVYYTIRRISSPLYCLFIFQYLYEIFSFQRQTPANRFSNEHNIAALSPSLSLLTAHARPDAERYKKNTKKGLRRVLSRLAGERESDRGERSEDQSELTSKHRLFSRRFCLSYRALTCLRALDCCRRNVRPGQKKAGGGLKKHPRPGR